MIVKSVVTSPSRQTSSTDIAASENATVQNSAAVQPTAVASNRSVNASSNSPPPAKVVAPARSAPSANSKFLLQLQSAPIVPITKAVGYQYPQAFEESFFGVDESLWLLASNSVKTSDREIKLLRPFGLKVRSRKV